MLRLTARHLREIERSAEAAYPEEACGLVVGRCQPDGTRVVAEVVPSANVSRDDKARNFEIDPELRFRTEKRLRGATASVIGHFHSHPNGQARPSERDLAMVFEPELIWLITGVVVGKADKTAAFLFDEQKGAFVETDMALLGRAQSP